MKYPTDEILSIWVIKKTLPLHTARAVCKLPVMSQHYLDILLFAAVATNATLLLFLAGVFRKMLNTIDESVFKQLVDLMYRYSTRSPFMIVLLNLPFLIAIPYFILYGFGNTLITTGIALWLTAGIISKYYKLPIYKRVLQLNGNERLLLKAQRRKFNLGNSVQAILYVASTITMGFGIH